MGCLLKNNVRPKCPRTNYIDNEKKKNHITKSQEFTTIVLQIIRKNTLKGNNKYIHIHVIVNVNLFCILMFIKEDIATSLITCTVEEYTILNYLLTHFSC